MPSAAAKFRKALRVLCLARPPRHHCRSSGQRSPGARAAAGGPRTRTRRRPRSAARPAAKLARARRSADPIPGHARDRRRSARSAPRRSECRGRRRDPRQAAHSRPRGPTPRARVPRARPPGSQPLSPTSSRASSKASRKSKATAFFASIIALKSPDSVLYLTSPMASGPMPSAPALADHVAVRLHVQALDAGRRHGVDVGARRAGPGPRRPAASRAPAGRPWRRRARPRLSAEHLGLLLVGAAVGEFDLESEALLDLGGRRARTRSGPSYPTSVTFAALQRADDGGGERRPRRSRRRSPRAGP